MTREEIKRSLTISYMIGAFGVAVGVVGAVLFHSIPMGITDLLLVIFVIRLQRYTSKL